MTRIFPVAAVLILLLAAGAIATHALPQAFALGTYPKKLRVIEVRYFPKGETDLIYHPDTLSALLQNLIRKSSTFQAYKTSSTTPSVEVEVVAKYNRQGPRPNIDGTWYTTYEKILEVDNLCQQIRDLDIDQIWLWVDPRPGYDTGPGVEYAISSNFFQNQVQYATYAKPAFCGGQDSFIFMGFDFSRPADYALHSFGHQMEGVLGNLQTVELFWQRFSGDDSPTFPRRERCGNVHFPPNADSAYKYNSRTYVKTSCESWKPDGTGSKRRLNCNRWKCTQEGFLQWWMQNMPNKNTSLTYQDKKLPNWWDFTVDMDEVIPAYENDASYFINREFLNANKPPVFPPSYDTTTTTKQNSGTSITWNHTTSGDNRLLVVSTSYRASVTPTAQLASVTYAGLPMNFLRRDKYHDFTTEMWSMTSPALGTSTVSATWTADPEDQVLAATSFKGIDQVAPIATSAGAGSAVLDPGSPGSQSIQITSSANEVVLGVLAIYPDGGSNQANNAGDTTEVWEVYTGNNNIGGYGGIEPGTPTTTLEWTSPKNWPWAATAVSLKLL